MIAAFGVEPALNPVWDYSRTSIGLRSSHPPTRVGSSGRAGGRSVAWPVAAVSFSPTATSATQGDSVTKLCAGLHRPHQFEYSRISVKRTSSIPLSECQRNTSPLVARVMYTRSVVVLVSVRALPESLVMPAVETSHVPPSLTVPAALSTRTVTVARWYFFRARYRAQRPDAIVVTRVDRRCSARYPN